MSDITEVESSSSYFAIEDDGYLGFFNRSCGTLPPTSVGPTVRPSSVQTWRQWKITLVNDTEVEQWGYLETYYPENWGNARCGSCGCCIALPRLLQRDKSNHPYG